jgi:hypothetical protein
VEAPYQRRTSHTSGLQYTAALQKLFHEGTVMDNASFSNYYGRWMSRLPQSFDLEQIYCSPLLAQI